MNISYIKSRLTQNGNVIYCLSLKIAIFSKSGKSPSNKPKMAKMDMSSVVKITFHLNYFFIQVIKSSHFWNVYNKSHSKNASFLTLEFKTHLKFKKFSKCRSKYLYLVFYFLETALIRFLRCLTCKAPPTTSFHLATIMLIQLWQLVGRQHPKKPWEKAL